MIKTLSKQLEILLTDTENRLL